jgi:hypothetical protein
MIESDEDVASRSRCAVRAGVTIVTFLQPTIRRNCRSSSSQLDGTAGR